MKKFTNNFRANNYRAIKKNLFFFVCFFVISTGLYGQNEDTNPLANPQMYKRGFLYSLTTPKVIPLHYQRINENLWVDKSLEIASSPDQTVTIWGLAVDIRNADLDLAAIAHNLATALKHSEEQFHCECDFICGRYAIMYTVKEGAKRIVTDATGMRTVYHSQDATLLAGHSKLLADNFAGRFIESKTITIPNAYPGRMTPYDGVFLLIPNTSVTIGSGAILRFYPRGPLQTLSATKVVDKIVPWLTNALMGARKRNPLVVSLTGGIDSRTTVSFVYYTYPQNPPTLFTYIKTGSINVLAEMHLALDAKIAEYIAKLLEIPHMTIDVDKINTSTPCSQQDAVALAANTFYKINPNAAVALIKVFDNKFIHIRSQLCEIGRAYYGKINVDIKTPDWLLELGRCQFKNGLQKGILDDYTLRSFLSDYAKKTKLNRDTLYNYDCRDIYYWEQRMATWAPHVYLEQDLAHETFIPWNARAIFTALLQVPFKDRRNATVFKKIVERFCPKIKELPINPQEWPLPNMANVSKDIGFEIFISDDDILSVGEFL